MKNIRYSIFSLAVAGFFFTGCNSRIKDQEKNRPQVVIDSLREELAPDSRVSLFDIKAESKANNYVVSGETTDPVASQKLKQKLKEEEISFIDSIHVLPDEEALEQKTRGVVKISVANLREHPAHASQLVTQATLGTPLKVYKKQGSWYYIQTPDGYLAWVDYGGIENMSKEEFSRWEKKNKLIYLNSYGKSFKSPGKNAEVVSDLVAGNIVNLESEDGEYYKISYPDGRTAYVPKEQATPYRVWLKNLKLTGEQLVATGEELMGLPYLWGGTSPKGVDCSGFTKTIYFLNGMIIPRDASQQIHTGILIDSTRNFQNLVPGDLLFFGKPATDSTKERVIHVGMWIGNDQFIHAMGDVHISTMDTTSKDFDEYNYNRYLRTKRILNQKSRGLQYLKEQDIFMQ